MGILPHGALFRGGAEGEIRRILIAERNYLDAVIGLPPNIFYGTAIPTCILVFKKCREHPDDILFIDASAYFERAKNQNSLRDVDIDKIVSTYRTRAEEDRYSHVASMTEIEANEYNLNIPRYVDTFEVEPAIDLGEVLGDLRKIDKDLKDTNNRIAAFCEELGLEAPL